MDLLPELLVQKPSIRWKLLLTARDNRHTSNLPKLLEVIRRLFGFRISDNFYSFLCNSGEVLLHQPHVSIQSGIANRIKIWSPEKVCKFRSSSAKFPSRLPSTQAQRFVSRSLDTRNTQTFKINLSISRRVLVEKFTREQKLAHKTCRFVTAKNGSQIRIPNEIQLGVGGRHQKRNSANLTNWHSIARRLLTRNGQCLPAHQMQYSSNLTVRCCLTGCLHPDYSLEIANLTKLNQTSFFIWKGGTRFSLSSYQNFKRQQILCKIEKHFSFKDNKFGWKTMRARNGKRDYQRSAVGEGRLRERKRRTEFTFFSAVRFIVPVCQSTEMEILPVSELQVCSLETVSV